MEINYVNVGTDIMKFLQSSGMYDNDMYENEKKQSAYLRKRMRIAPSFKKFDDKEKKQYEKIVVQVVHQYTVDEEVEYFTFAMFYRYIQKVFTLNGKM